MKQWFGALVLAASMLFAPVAFAAEATLTWDSNTETDLAGYKVYRGNAIGGTCPIGPLQPLVVSGTAVSVPKSATATTTYTDATVPVFDGQLCYEVTAYDTSGNESARSTRGVKTVNLVPPVAPKNLGIGNVVP